MKVNIGPYTTWIGPYQIAEKILFWMDKNNDDRVHNFGRWLSGGKDKDSLLMKLCSWIESKKKRKIKVHIDGYDVWSMDSTLSIIILPMLEKLREAKHGSPMVDAEDVPEYLRMTGHEDWSQQQQFKFDDQEQYEKDSWEINMHRWDWVIDEMIWTFKQLQPDYDWEEIYRSGVMDIAWLPDSINSDYKIMSHGPNHTYKIDEEGTRKHQERINNGLRLFGKYFQNLWD